MSRRSEKPANRGKAAAARSDLVVPQVPGGPGTQVRFWRRDWFPGLVLVLAALIAYQPVWHAGFIWDDDMHLTANPAIVGPSGLLDIWTSRAARICPLVLTTFWVEHAFWGLRPLPYHVVNVLMHGACAIALWHVLRSLRVRGAWLGAALWALHPVQVETVAWVTELKNTQSCLFYLLAVQFFVKWTGAGEAGTRARSYALALIFAALAMASKSSTVVLPLVMGLCAWWTERRLTWRVAATLGPVFLMSAAASALAIWTQHLEGANDAEWARGWPERVVVSGRIFWFYAGKLLWPHPLVFIYPRWNIDGAQASGYLPTAAMVALMAILWWGRNGRLRPIFFSFGYFLAALLPVLGLVDQFFWRYSFVGDHFQYLASMGPLALAAAAIVTAFGLLRDGAPYAKGAFCGAVLTALGLLTWRQCAVYRNMETLWRATIRGNPRCWMAYNNLGIALAGDGRLDEAIATYERALESNPDYVETHNNLGIALLKAGRTDEAIAQFRRALEIKPGDVETHNNLANALMRATRIDEAIAVYRKALELDPDFAETHNNLGIALSKAGKTDEAIAQFQRALEIKPGDVGAHSNLGGAFLREKRINEAIAQFQAALAIAPRNVKVLDSLGNASLMGGRPDEAAGYYQQALQVEPNDAQALNNLGYVFLQLGRADEAIAIFQGTLDRVLQTEPKNTAVRINLGRALLQKGRLEEAVAQFQRAAELEPRGAEAHFSLGIALLAMGKVDEAIAQYRVAVEINPNNADFHRNLGDALAKKGRNDEAGAQFQEADRLRRP